MCGDDPKHGPPGSLWEALQYEDDAKHKAMTDTELLEKSVARYDYKWVELSSIQTEPALRHFSRYQYILP